MSADDLSQGPADAPADIPDELVLELRRPVTFAGVQYDTLRLLEPTAGQLIEAEKGGSPLEQLARLVHLVAAVPRKAVDQMGQRDFQRAADFFALFGAGHR